MLISLHRSFCLLFSLSLLIPLVSSETIECDILNRPTLETCSNQPFETTCSYYKNNCPLEVCARPASSGCYACLDPDALYYEKKECDDSLLVLSCEDNSCNPDELFSYYHYFIPACGLQKEDDYSVTTETFETICKICQDTNYKYFQIGPCEKERVYCKDSNAPDNTEDSGSSVCAYFHSEDITYGFATVSSGSEACKDPSVEYWTKGECQQYLGNTSYCLPNNRPQDCPSDYDPVCGFFYDANDDTFHKIYNNACLACSAPEVLYHNPGPCILSCEFDVVDEKCDGWIEPICGTYEDFGQERKASLRNPCIGCNEIDKKVTTFTDGLCPGEKGIRCSNEADVSIEDSFSPVCGYTTDDCNDQSCRKTYSEPNSACSANLVLWYSPGACVGDEGVPCDDFRTRPENAKFVYENVCGYGSQGCQDDSCRQIFDDQYAACGTAGILYFTQGPC